MQDRRGQTFTVRSYKLSGVHLLFESVAVVSYLVKVQFVTVIRLPINLFLSENPLSNKSGHEENTMKFYVGISSEQVWGCINIVLVYPVTSVRVYKYCVLLKNSTTKIFN